MFYSIEQLLEMVPVSKATLYRMIKAGRFPEPVTLFKRRVAVRKEDYDFWYKLVSYRLEDNEVVA